MNRGYIKIKGSEDHSFQVNGNLLLIKHEMTDLFNTNISMVGNNLLAIFKSGILHKENVICVHLFEWKGKPFTTMLYNLEAVIFLSYRIGSGIQAMGNECSLRIYRGQKNVQAGEALITYNLIKNLLSIISLN